MMLRMSEERGQVTAATDGHIRLLDYLNSGSGLVHESKCVSKFNAPEYVVSSHYLVVAGEGVLVRSDMELTSAQLGLIAFGAVVESDRSEVNSQGVTRVRLSGGRGWVSMVGSDGQTKLLEKLDQVENLPMLSDDYMVRDGCLRYIEMTSAQLGLNSLRDVEGERYEANRKNLPEHVKNGSTKFEVAELLDAHIENVETLFAGQGEDGSTKQLESAGERCTHLVGRNIDGHVGLGCHLKVLEKLGTVDNDPAQPVSPCRYVVVAGGGVLVRAGMGLTSAEVGLIPCGAVIEADRCEVNSRGMLRVRLSGDRGWVSMVGSDGQTRLLEREDDVEDVVDSGLGVAAVVDGLSRHSPSAYRVVIGGGVLAREGPELCSGKREIIACGSVVAVSEHRTNSLGLVRVRLSDDRGWVSVVGADGHTTLLKPVEDCSSRQEMIGEEGHLAGHIIDAGSMAGCGEKGGSDNLLEYTDDAGSKLVVISEECDEEDSIRLIDSAMDSSAMVVTDKGDCIRRVFHIDVPGPLVRNDSSRSMPLTPSCSYRVCSAGGILIRRDVELSSEKVGILAYGRIVEVSDHILTPQGLIRARLSDGRGWVSVVGSDGQTQLLEKLGTVDNDPAQPVSPCRYVVVAGGGVLVRAGMELTSAEVGLIPCGAVIEADSCKVNSRGMLRVRLSSDRGWVSMVGSDGQTRLLEREDDVEDVVDSGLSVAAVVDGLSRDSPSVYRVVIGGGVLVREGPELCSGKREIIACGSVVAVSEHRTNSLGLVRVRLLDGRGWVSVVGADGHTTLLEPIKDGGSILSEHVKNGTLKVLESVGPSSETEFSGILNNIRTIATELSHMDLSP